MTHTQSALFFGTKKDFNKYIGPRLRNLVQQLTKKHKNEVKYCEHCNTSKNLESAHVHGQERTTITKEILKESLLHGAYEINLIEFERQFKERHANLKDVIKVLCKACHSKYDLDNKKTILITEPIKQEEAQDLKSNKLEDNKEIKIGALVRKTLPEMLRNGAISTSEIEKLQDENYSKVIFNVNYPVLRKIDFKKSLKENRLVNNYTRYYTFITAHDEQQYLITSEWYQRSLYYYVKWLKRKDNAIVIK